MRSGVARAQASAAASPAVVSAASRGMSNPPAGVCAPIPFPRSRRRFDAPAPLRVWHLTSLDAPTVAAVWTLAFGWAAGIRLPGWIAILVALAAWAVYIADRLLDARTAARRGDLSSLRERHHFHRRHRRLLVPVAVGAACAGACIAFALMSAPARECGSLLACAAVAYFATVHAPAMRAYEGESDTRVSSRIKLGAVRLGLIRFVPGRPGLIRKELLVGLIFTAACALPTLSRIYPYRVSTTCPLLAAILVFCLLAWLNCHAIDRWEDADASRRATGIAAPACGLGFAACLFAASLLSQQPRIASLLASAAASSLLLALLDRLRPRLTPLALRALADLVLLSPMVLLLPHLLIAPLLPPAHLASLWP